MGIFISIFLGITSFLVGPNPQEEFDKYKELYPGEPVVYSLKQHSIDYSIKADTIYTVLHIYEEMIHLEENTLQYSSETVYSSQFAKVQNLKAYTLLPQKKKYEKIEVTEFKETFDEDSYVFYDDSKLINFNFPGIAKGAKTVVEYDVIIKDPRFIGPFYIESYIPIHKAKYEATYDEGVTLSNKYFDRKNIELKTEEGTTKDGRRSKTITASQIAGMKYERNAPSFKWLSSSIYLPVKTFTNSSGEEVPMITDPANLHDWYRTFIEKIQDKDPSIESLVKQIVDEDDSEIEKVKKIYDWVQSNIKYIAFEDGMRGYIPHPGNYVIEKRYGDCKDMASAIVSMLREADIDAQYSWIGTRKLPYTYSETPSPITDNHMIATIELNDTIYFLDATGSYSPMDLPTEMLQGKECLISYSDDDFKIVKVPEISKERNTILDSIWMKIEDGKVIGKGSARLNGYHKVNANYRLIKTNQTKVDKYLQNVLQKGSNKFVLEDYTLGNLEDLYKPTTIDYEFTIADYYQNINGTIYINPILDKSLSEAFIDKREQPLENDYKYTIRDVTIFEIPEGYKVESVPENTTDQNDNFGFSIRYEIRDDVLLIEKEIFVDYLIMEIEEFEEWNSIITDYSKATRNALILTKN